MIARQRKCPECGAEPGEPCRDRPPGTAATWCHLGRNVEIPTEESIYLTESGGKWKALDRNTGRSVEADSIDEAMRLIREDSGLAECTCQVGPVDGDEVRIPDDACPVHAESAEQHLPEEERDDGDE